jgi:glycosyltransferase involved in cell wall biosynthesis
MGRSAGLGSTLFVPVYIPRVPIVNLFDYYYHPHDHDLACDWHSQPPVEYFHWRRSAVAMELMDLENGVVPWTRSVWQRDLFPAEYRTDFRVQFDGVDTQRFRRREDRPRTLAGRTIPPETRVVTFMARNLDRTRGFDRFVELADRLLRARTDVICIAAGDSIVHRGLDVEFYGKDYRSWLLGSRSVHAPERFWCTGGITPAVASDLLALSDVHTYPSRPYAVSHSLLEGMAAGCVVVASDDAAVREFVRDGETGVLVPGDDADAWERSVLEILQAPAAFRSLGDAAAAAVQSTYSQEVALPRLASLLSEVACT